MQETIIFLFLSFCLTFTGKTFPLAQPDCRFDRFLQAFRICNTLAGNIESSAVVN
jgi:hypothetical protein